MYEKTIISHPLFYIAQFTKNSSFPYLLFLHGGPGFNNGTLEYFILNENFFAELNYNIIFYDQRGCGKSAPATSDIIHNDNITDLFTLYHYLISERYIKLKAIIGHSYGAKLLVDFYQRFPAIRIPAILVAIARSMLTPRVNNLLLDLTFLKANYPERYKSLYQGMTKFNLNSIWELTENLADIFQENKNRPYAYWANLDIYEKVKNIKNLPPISNPVFKSVRRSLYLNLNQLSIEPEKLGVRYLWINGFFDYVMNGAAGVIEKQPSMVVFGQSAHYPHLEENKLFCETLNEFLETA